MKIYIKKIKQKKSILRFLFRSEFNINFHLSQFTYTTLIPNFFTLTSIQYLTASTNPIRKNIYIKKKLKNL